MRPSRVIWVADRIVCLRVHPSFRVQNISEASVQFTSVGGERKELRGGGGEVFLKGQDRPNGIDCQPPQSVKE